MPRFVKGSQEAKEYMAMIRSKKSGEKKPPNPNKGIRKLNTNTKLKMPIMSEQEIAVPEFFANENVNRKGKITYKLVNPLTKSRNLSKRNGETSIKLIRKPIDDMIIMSHTTEPISLSLFNKEDREIINKHYKVVGENKNKKVVDIPLSKPFENEERGRPEILPKNIEINRLRNKSKKEEKTKKEENIKMDINETAQPKPKRQYVKHQTDEDRRKSILESKRAYAKKAYAKKTGKGIFDDIKKAGSKAINKVVDTAKSVSKSVEQYANVVINGRNDYPPKVRTILEKVGNQTITSIVIGRTPVPSVLTSALSLASGGVFGKNLQNSPYDTLFHLFIRCELTNGQTVTMEKNEVINMDIDPPIPPNTQIQNVSNLPEGLTPITILDNAKKIQGGKFFGYSARDNNCQDFILAIFNGSNIGNQEDRAFIKQDTKQLFGNMTGLRKLSNTITDLGAKVNEITTGAGLTDKVIKHLNKDNKEMVALSKAFKTHLKTEKLSGKGVQPDFIQYSEGESSDSGSSMDENVYGTGIKKKDYKVQSVVIDKDKYSVKEAKKWLKDNGYKCPKIDITENTYRFRQIPPNKIEKEGYTTYRMKPLGKSGVILVIAYKPKNKISSNTIMPKFVKGSQEAKDYMAKIRGMKGKGVKPVVMMGNGGQNIHTGSSMTNAINRMKMTGGGLGLGLYSSGGDVSADSAGADSGGMGLYAGGGQSGVGRGMKKHKKKTMSIDSGSDTDSEYDEPQQGTGIHIHHHYHIKGGKLSKIGQAFNKAFNPSKNGVSKAVNTAVNDVKEAGPEIENGAKVVAHYAIPSITSALGGAAGTALGGPLGGVAGSALGAYGGQQIDRALGIENNTSFDGKGIRKGKFIKGSKEAKEYMASLRAKRGKGLY
jgi:hypothetical protein